MNLRMLKANAIGIPAFLVAFTVGGMLLAFIYAIIMRLIENIFAGFIAVFIFAAVLAVGLYFLRKLLKLENNYIVFALALIGLAVIYYIALSGDSRFLQTVTIPVDTENPIGGIIYYYGDDALHSVFRFLEIAIIFAATLIATFMFDGVYLHDYDKWAEIRHYPYAFSRFNGEEKERISLGDVSVILQKPFATSDEFSTVSRCYVNSQPTEYIALFKSTLANNGKTRHTAPSKAIPLSPDALEYLEAQLVKKYNDELEEDYHGT